MNKIDQGRDVVKEGVSMKESNHKEEVKMKLTKDGERNDVYI